MPINELITANKAYIDERLLQTRRKFEIMINSNNDLAKQNEYMNLLKQIEVDRKKLNADLFEMPDLNRYNITLEDLQENKANSMVRTNINDYTILRNIPIQKLNEVSHNEEINSIWSYLLFFEKEYLGLLSEQNLRLDYGHAYQREKFFTVFNETIRVLQRYGEMLQEIEGAEKTGNNAYKERLLGLQSKQYRDVIIRTGRFLQSLKAFMDDIFDSEANGEKVLMEPDKIVEISGGQSNIDGITSREALKDLELFIKEYIEFLKIPEIRKIEDEE